MHTATPQPILYMAPLKGVTDHTFRSTFAAHFGGFDLAVAPFIASKKNTAIKRRYVRDVWPEHNTRLPVIPQILGKSAADFIVLADFLYDQGYETVNWNLGCPYPMVANKRRGAGMLPHTDMIAAFLDRVVPGMRASLSIKIRLGWDSPDDIYRLIPVLNQYPLNALIIHPRTGIQRYDGPVDLDTFGRCLPSIVHPVVYNGDIRTPEDFRALSRRFATVSRWMIGRWSLADPFLPQAIKTGETRGRDKIARIKRFHETLYASYRSILDGPSHLLNKMKGLWKYLSLPFNDCKKAMKAINKSHRPEQYLDRVNRFFDTQE